MGLLILLIGSVWAVSGTVHRTSGGSRGDPFAMGFLPDFQFTKMNGHPIEKLNLELKEGKRILVLYFSRAYQRG